MGKHSEFHRIGGRASRIKRLRQKPPINSTKSARAIRKIAKFPPIPHSCKFVSFVVKHPATPPQEFRSTNHANLHESIAAPGVSKSESAQPGPLIRANSCHSWTNPQQPRRRNSNPRITPISTNQSQHLRFPNPYQRNQIPHSCKFVPFVDNRPTAPLHTTAANSVCSSQPQSSSTDSQTVTSDRQRDDRKPRLFIVSSNSTRPS